MSRNSSIEADGKSTNELALSRFDLFFCTSTDFAFELCKRKDPRHLSPLVQKRDDACDDLDIYDDGWLPLLFHYPPQRSNNGHSLRQQQMLHTRTLLRLHGRHNFIFQSTFFFLHINFHTHSAVSIVRRSFSRAYVRLR